MTMLIDYLKYDIKYNSGQYDFALNMLKLEIPNGQKRFNRTSLDALLDVLPQPIEKSDMDRIYEIAVNNPQATVTQVIHMFKGEKVEAVDTIENPFGENGKYKSYIDRIKNTTVWAETLDETDQANLHAYLYKLVQDDPNRFERLVNSGYFELCSEGKIDIKSGLMEMIGTKKFLSKTYLEDVRRLYKGEPLVKHYSEGMELDVLSKVTPEGEVVSVGEQLYVNDSGTMVKLKISQKTFERLFPLELRFNTKQGNIGDCWLISAIENFMDSPSGRAKIYQLFEENGKDITITFPPKKGYASAIATFKISDEFKVSFPNGAPFDALGKQISGCDGLKMLEQAYSFKRGNRPKENITLEDMASLADTDTQMQRLSGGMSEEFINDVLGYSKLGNYYAYDIVDAKNHKVGKRIPISSRDGVSDTVDIIKEFANNPNILIHASTINLSDDVEHLLDAEYSIYSNHAYTIKGYNEETGMVYFTNPHNTKCIIEMDVYKFLGYFESLMYVRIN